MLEKLRRQLRDLQKPQTLHDLHNLAGHAVHELVMEGFRGEHDPYGVPWKPTQQKNPTLQRTLALRDGILWKADSRGVVIRTSGKANKYAAFHQYGTAARSQPVNSKGQFRSYKSTSRLKKSVAIRLISGLPAREFLPREGNMPPALEARLRNDFSRYFREKYG